MLLQMERPPCWIRRENYLNMAAVTWPSVVPKESKARVCRTCWHLSFCTGVSGYALLAGVCLSWLYGGRETSSACLKLREPGSVKGDRGEKEGRGRKRGSDVHQTVFLHSVCSSCPTWLSRARESIKAPLAGVRGHTWSPVCWGSAG